MAQIHALLLVSAEPLSTEDIMEQLEVSRGNVNMNTTIVPSPQTESHIYVSMGKWDTKINLLVVSMHVRYYH